MKRLIGATILLTLSVSSIGCHLPDFSAGRLSHAFPSAATAQTDPFLDSDLQADLSSPHSSAAPRTFTENRNNIARQTKTGRARLTAYVPPVSNNNLHNNRLQMARPPATFEQAGYGQTHFTASPQNHHLLKNRFANLPETELADPFAETTVQNAAYEEPVNFQAEIEQTSGIVNPFNAKEMVQAHVPKVGPINIPKVTVEKNNQIEFPLEHLQEEKPANNNTQWKRHNSKATLVAPNAINNQFVQPMQRH